MKFITCPKCGYQYLPGEIFDPKHFIGQPKNIVRNTFGEILGYEGISSDLKEIFICENCDTKLNIFAKVSFEALDDESLRTSNEYGMESVELF